MEKSYLIPTRSNADYFCITPTNGSTNISWDWLNSYPTAFDIDLQYSYDVVNWTNYTLGTNVTTSVPTYWRGKNVKGFGSSYNNNANICKLTLDNYCNLSGRLSSLTQKFLGSIPSCPRLQIGGTSIFSGNSYIYSIKDLVLDYILDAPQDQVNHWSQNYANLFSNCTSLIDTPVFLGEIKSTGVKACSRMFWNCTSLTTIYDLPAPNSEACFSEMFIGCTSLQEPPKLPALTLTKYCYEHMFSQCTGLRKLPRLEATVLPDGCYQYMFCIDYNEMLSTTQDSTYQYEFRIPTTNVATSIGTNVLFHIFNTLTSPQVTPQVNTTYYCKLPTASE